MKKDERDPKDYVELPWGKLKPGMVAWGIFNDITLSHKEGVGSDVRWIGTRGTDYINWSHSRLVKKGSF